MHHRSGSRVKGHYRNGTWVAGHNRKGAYVSDYTKSSYSRHIFTRPNVNTIFKKAKALILGQKSVRVDGLANIEDNESRARVEANRAKTKAESVTRLKAEAIARANRLEKAARADKLTNRTLTEDNGSSKARVEANRAKTKAESVTRLKAEAIARANRLEKAARADKLNNIIAKGVLVKYDENGFDKDWMHIHTKKMICFDKKIKDLFFYHDDLYILKELIAESPIINPKRAKYKKPIKLIDVKQTTNQIDNRPKSLDGSPDMRYNVNYTTKYHTIFTFNIEKTDIKKTFNEYFSEKKIQEAIDNYNFYLQAIQDTQVEELYNILIDINSKCVENKKLSIQLMTDIKENIIIYKKLEKHQEKFSKEQQDKFSKLGQNIKIIENKIKDIDSFDEEFEKVYQKFLIRLNEIKESSMANELNDLFSQIK